MQCVIYLNFKLTNLNKSLLWALLLLISETIKNNTLLVVYFLYPTLKLSITFEIVLKEDDVFSGSMKNGIKISKWYFWFIDANTSLSSPSSKRKCFAES